MVMWFQTAAPLARARALRLAPAVHQQQRTFLNWIKRQFQLSQLRSQWGFKEEEFTKDAAAAYQAVLDTVNARDVSGLRAMRRAIHPTVMQKLEKFMKTNTQHVDMEVYDAKMEGLVGRMKEDPQNEESTAYVIMIMKARLRTTVLGHWTPEELHRLTTSPDPGTKSTEAETDAKPATGPSQPAHSEDLPDRVVESHCMFVFESPVVRLQTDYRYSPDLVPEPDWQLVVISDPVPSGDAHYSITVFDDPNQAHDRDDKEVGQRRTTQHTRDYDRPRAQNGDEEHDQRHHNDDRGAQNEASSARGRARSRARSHEARQPRRRGRRNN